MILTRTTMKHKTKPSPPPKSGQSSSEKGSSRSSSPQDDSTDLEDIPISLPEFAEIDHAKSYPTISASIQKSLNYKGFLLIGVFNHVNVFLFQIH